MDSLTCVSLFIRLADGQLVDTHLRVHSLTEWRAVARVIRLNCFGPLGRKRFVCIGINADASVADTGLVPFFEMHSRRDLPSTQVAAMLSLVAPSISSNANGY